MQAPINETALRRDIEKIVGDWLGKREKDPRSYGSAGVCAYEIVTYLKRFIKHREETLAAMASRDERDHKPHGNMDIRKSDPLSPHTP